MSIIIKDGKGGGKSAQVDAQNRLSTKAVSEAEEIHAADIGNAYNVNTGLISISDDATLLYIKNNEDQPIVVKAIALGSFEGITHSDDPYITIVRNPTAGDLISDGSAVDMNQNRNFGSSSTLSVDAFKGKTSGTLTGGNDLGILQATAGGRSFYTIDLNITQGSSMGIKLTANVTSGSANWYCAAICYVKEVE
jgi:hypothetical protein